MHVYVMETKTVQPTAFTALFSLINISNFNNGGDQADMNSEHLFRLTILIYTLLQTMKAGQGPVKETTHSRKEH